jgi:hypothetical protein
MIPAAQMLHVTFALDHQRPAMRTDVREAVELMVAPTEDNRLVQQPRKKCGGEDMPRRPDVSGIPNPLPAASKDALPQGRKDLRIRIRGAGERPGLANIRVDGEL